MEYSRIIELARAAYPHIGNDAIKALADSYRLDASDAEQLKAAADAMTAEADRAGRLVEAFVESTNAELAKLTATIDRINAQHKRED